ncbi:MAG: hypothetical protein BGO01_01030 [Armatimonadetes bacterium 55-13]|nr:MAG: hypothetical protein BGO01_01030 [Armatimonadetes bacterium 55-13]
MVVEVKSQEFGLGAVLMVGTGGLGLFWAGVGAEWLNLAFWFCLHSFVLNLLEAFYVTRRT